MKSAPAQIRNLLKMWYRETAWLSSTLNVSAKVSRAEVDFICSKLKKYFGEKFFDVVHGRDAAITKISWLFSLLSNSTNIGCIHALYDVCQLAEYAHGKDNRLATEFLQLKRNPGNLRTFFFELFTYRLLDKGNVAFTVKPVEGNQVLEGTCELLGEKFLFECRKNFLPRIEELDVMRRLLQDIWLHGHNLEKGRGMIITIQLNRPVEGRHRDVVGQELRRYFERLNNNHDWRPTDYAVETQQGTMKCSGYDEATRIEEEMLKKPDILFYMKPPLYPVEGYNDFYPARMLCNYAVSEKAVYKKIEQVLKEKTSQHEQSAIASKIIFLDSETLPEFHMNIFQSESMYNLQKVKKVYDKLGLKSIVCVVRRSYDQKGLQLAIDIIAPERLQPHANFLLGIFKKVYQ